MKSGLPKILNKCIYYERRLEFIFQLLGGGGGRVLSLVKGIKTQPPI